MHELLAKLSERISPHNGLVVNARVWEEAHGYHQVHHQAHLLYGHGPGIITGLKARIENEEARLWVQPGLALDPRGRIIVHEEPDSTRLGSTRPGLMYVYLQAEETESDDRVDQNDARQVPFYVRLGYKINSGFSLPEDAVELARIRLEQPDAPIKTAQDPAQPGPNELDLRFRSEVGANPQGAAWLAIGYLGEQTGALLPKFERRAGELAQALSHLTRRKVCIDDDVAFAYELQPYTLVYLIEQGPYALGPDKLDALKAYLESGGTLLVESFQTNSPLLRHLASQEVALSDDLEPLLAEPFLFSAPPPGARSGEVLLGEGIIFSSRDYGHLWQRRDPAVPREMIRTATEWAANLVSYAINRRYA